MSTIPRILPVVMAAWVVLGLLATADAHAARAVGDDYKPGELLVRFKPGAGPTDAAATRLAGVARATHRRVFSHMGMEHWTLPAGADLDSTLQALRDSGTVEFAEPNYRRHLRVTADACNDQWGLADAKVRDVSTKGVAVGTIPVRVAVIDTGVDAAHPELADSVDTGWDVVDGDADASPDPNDPVGWHGTAVASVIGAAGEALSGVAPEDVVIVPIRTDFYVDSLIEAYNAAIDRHVRIINASWGGPQFSMAEQEGIALLEEAGILVVAAAGNYEVNNDLIPDYPSGLPNGNIIAVAASGQDGGLTYWSQYGARHVDLAAPGADIKVAKPGNQYDCYSGTSFSAPHVTGLAALLMSKYPDEPLQDIKARILAGVQALATGKGLLATDGRMDAQAALAISAPRPVIVYADHVFSDTQGNGNGVAEPGETVSLTVVLENLWAEAHNVSVALASDDPALEVQNEENVIGAFPQGKRTMNFTVRLAPDAAGYHRLPLQVRVYADEFSEPLVRRFTAEWGVLHDGATASAVVQSHDQDDMHLWKVHVAPGTGRLALSLMGSGGDLDLLVRQGSIPQFDWYYCGRKSRWWCAEQGTSLSNGNASDESVMIDNPAPGVYYVSVVNLGKTGDVAYTLGVNAGGGGGGGGGEGGWLAMLAAVVVALRGTARRVRAVWLALPFLLMGCVAQDTAARVEPAHGGEYLVTFADHVERADALAQLQAAGAEVIRAYQRLPIFHIRAPAGMSDEQVQIHLRQLPDVIAVEPNVRRRPYIDP